MLKGSPVALNASHIVRKISPSSGNPRPIRPDAPVLLLDWYKFAKVRLLAVRSVPFNVAVAKPIAPLQTMPQEEELSANIKVKVAHLLRGEENLQRFCNTLTRSIACIILKTGIRDTSSGAVIE